MSAANGFPQISGVFFSVFDPKQGSKPLCQVPDGAVQQTATSEISEPLIKFDSIKNYVIPKPVLCNRLVAILCNGYRVIGYPVNIVGNHYERNSFTFNLCFIFPENADTSSYESVISRTAKMFRALEEQSHFISDLNNLVSLDSAVEQMFQDLNSFSECQIPIDAVNKLDIKLFPIIEAPPVLHGYDVPVATVRLGALVDETWDPTLERLLPHINGSNSIQRISDLASADFKLTIKAIQHLVHYGCVVTLDIFQFSNVYSPTSTVADICDPQIFHEFCYYVYKYKHAGKQSASGLTGNSPSGLGSVIRSGLPSSNSESLASSIPNTNSVPISSVPRSLVGSAGSVRGSFNRSHRASQTTHHSVVGPASILSMKQVFKLYSSFHLGLPLSSWCSNHQDVLQDIDLNRFLSFGILKRIIYRAHSYPVWISPKHIPSKTHIQSCLKNHAIDESHADLIMQCIECPTHFDDLCSQLRESRAVVHRVLKSIGDWSIVNM